MADTPPVSGPVPYWYTGAAQKKQFEAGVVSGFGGNADDPIGALANPPQGALNAEAHYTQWVADVVDGSIVYPTPDGGPGVD